MEKKFILNTTNYYRELYIDNASRPVVVISPGGGYKYTSERESLPVARFYNTHGFHAVVVNYRETVEEKYPMTTKYLAEVMKIVKNDNRCKSIIGLGFSAGGHCILDLSLHYKDYGIKPDLLMLGYPVVTSDERYSHIDSFKNLLKEDYNNKDLFKYVSLETQVTPEAPDLFLFGTFTDESVNVMNSLLLLEAYKANNCNAEYHVFPMGGHGLSLGTEETANGDPKKVLPYYTDWANYSVKWIKNKLNIE
ncbi:MAG: alpha/beta hydrolase fold domain-containing protein [Acholeplasmatales bacterium]|nr:alpha/beta hydrolase fold domain-containing protein [Acholeplasmatales bacterium]